MSKILFLIEYCSFYVNAFLGSPLIHMLLLIYMNDLTNNLISSTKNLLLTFLIKCRQKVLSSFKHNLDKLSGDVKSSLKMKKAHYLQFLFK